MSKENIAEANAATVEAQTAELQQASAKNPEPFDPTNLSVPTLSDMDESQISEVSEYWTPEDKGETKLVFFDSMAVEDLVDEDTGEMRKLPSVVLWEQSKEGQMSKISNSSARLVGHFEKSNYLQGQPLKIVYTGKAKNKNNSYQSDTWDVFKLFPKK